MIDRISQKLPNDDCASVFAFLVSAEVASVVTDFAPHDVGRPRVASVSRSEELDRDFGRTPRFKRQRHSLARTV